MKVLIATPDLFDEALPEFQKNRTGFGMMVRKTAEYISTYNEVIVFTKTLTGGYCINNDSNNIFIWKHLWFNLLLDASYKDYYDGICIFFKFRQKIRKRMKYFAYYLNRGSFRKCIFSCKPDIVHIHGISYATKPFIEVCEELHQPYLVTLHGSIGLSDSINLLPHEKQIEEDFLHFAENNYITVTTVSSGTKKSMIKRYGLCDNNCFIVIPNGIDILPYRSGKKKEIHALYNVPKGNQIVLVIGSIYKNKNQIQVVRAFNYLPLDLQNKTYIFFIGQNCDKGQLQQQINESIFCDHFIVCGFIGHDELVDYYQSASLNVIASITEGFGLSSIEAFHYGVPTVMFGDLDAVEDLYDPCAVLLVEDRSDESLADGITRALNMTWNHLEIYNYAKKFSVKDMVQRYQITYDSIIKNKK